MKKKFFTLSVFYLISFNSLSAWNVTFHQNDSDERRYQIIKNACEQSHRYHVDKKAESSCHWTIATLFRKMVTQINSVFYRQIEINGFPSSFTDLKHAIQKNRNYTPENQYIHEFINERISRKYTKSLKILSSDHLYSYCKTLVKSPNKKQNYIAVKKSPLKTNITSQTSPHPAIKEAYKSTTDNDLSALHITLNQPLLTTPPKDNENINVNGQTYTIHKSSNNDLPWTAFTLVLFKKDHDNDLYVLTQKRSDGKGIETPGGHLTNGQSWVQGAQAELEQESGIKLKETDFRFLKQEKLITPKSGGIFQNTTFFSVLKGKKIPTIHHPYHEIDNNYGHKWIKLKDLYKDINQEQDTVNAKKQRPWTNGTYYGNFRLHLQSFCEQNPLPCS